LPKKNLTSLLPPIFNDAKTNIDRTLRLLDVIRSGECYHASNKRKFLLGTYKNLVAHLNHNEYDQLKLHILKNLSDIINDRKALKLSYSGLTQLIEYSSQLDMDVYCAYENLIVSMAEIRPARYCDFVLPMIDACFSLTKDINRIEDFFIRTYIHPYKRYVNPKYLLQYAYAVKAANKKKLLLYLHKARPFYNDTNIIGAFVEYNPELGKIAILL